MTTPSTPSAPPQTVEQTEGIDGAEIGQEARSPHPRADDFGEWIRVLDEDVIQEEFGYERGEFTVYPSEWRSLFDEDLTPREAWQRALDAFAEARAEREREQAENWKRIQAADALAIARARAAREGVAG